MDTNVTTGQLAGHSYVYQAGNSSSRRVFLLLHGVGADEYDLLGLGRHLDPSAHLLSPRGAVFDEGANRFFRRLPDGSFDSQEVAERAKQLADFITEAKRVHSLDEYEIVAIGFSNGANMAASMLLLEPAAFNSAALLRVKLPLVPPTLPDLHGCRILALSGEQDSIMPRASAEELTALLKEAGADVRHDWVDAGHGLTQVDVERIIEWLSLTR
ncbi:putative hydrolase MhqD [compost metagenome]